MARSRPPAWLPTCCSGSRRRRTRYAHWPAPGTSRTRWTRCCSRTTRRPPRTGWRGPASRRCAPRAARSTPGRGRRARGGGGYRAGGNGAHGAEGRWVRRAAGPEALAAALAELAQEGPGALIVQPEVVESAGTSIRAVLTGGRLLAVTERRAAAPEWRSNIAGGAAQCRAELTGEEAELVRGAAAALGLGHARVDLLRTGQGPPVLEVNSCPDFTSMQPHYQADLAEAVLRASLLPGPALPALVRRSSGTTAPGPRTRPPTARRRSRAWPR